MLINLETIQIVVDVSINLLVTRSYCILQVAANVIEKKKRKFILLGNNVIQASSDEVEKSYERFSLEVTSIEEEVRHALCTNYEDVSQY